MFVRTALLALLVIAASASAQDSSGALSGTVTDPQDGAVRDALVSAAHTQTKLERRIHTDALGRYRFAGLPSGNYEVRVGANGFKTGVRTGVRLAAGQEAAADFRLEVGDLQQVVSVVAEQTTVSARGGAIEQLVSQQQIENLPLNGRDLTQLALLQKGVVQSRGSTRDINVGFGTKLSVGGARPNQNLFVIDGADANDALNATPAGATGQMTGVETIAEFRVSANPMNAKFGRAAGGVFSMVTKSGGNELHGSLFGFHRNDNFDARNFFDADRPEFRRHQFGGSLGGPVVRNRTFFFGSYEGFRENKGVTQVALVPDLAVRRAAPGDRIDFEASGDSVVLQPQASPLLALFPMPTGPEVAVGTHVAEFRGVLDRFGNEDFFSVRADHRLSESGSLFVRYLSIDSEFLTPVLMPAYPNLNTNRRQIVTVGQTETLSPSSVLESSFSFNRSTPAEAVPTPPDELNIPLIADRNLGSVNVTAGDGLPGLTEAGTDRTNPKSFFNNTWQLSSNLSLERGRHSIGMGALFERFEFDANSESRTRGRLEFRSLRRLLADDPRRIEGASAQSDFAREFRQSLLGLYVQDDIRVTRSLRLFAGLRWEFVTTPSEANGKIANLTDIWSADGQVIVEAPHFAAPDAESSALCCRKLFDNPTRRNLSPRLGLAWDVGGLHRTVVRAGFGLFYEQPLFSIYRSPAFRALPFVERSRINADEWPGGASIDALPLDPAIFASPGAGQETESMQYELAPTYLIRHNAEIEQDVGRNSVVSLGYAGSRGVNLFGQADTNLAIPQILPDGRQFFADNTRRKQTFDSIRSVHQGYNSWYHSLQAGWLKRHSDGLSWQASYTFSRCIDERSSVSGRQAQRFGQARAFDPYNRTLDKGLCDYHLGHTLVLSHVWDVPVPKHWRGPAAALRDWRFNGILNVSSGLPFTPYVEGDPDNDGSDDNSARPDVVGDPSSGSCANGAPVGTPDCWFNPAAFAFPGFGFRGNLGRNTLLGPGLTAYDTSLTRIVRLSERFELQLRAEAFNLFNQTNLNPPSNGEDGARIFSEDGLLDPTGASISERSGTATTSRQLQFGLRLTF